MNLLKNQSKKCQKIHVQLLVLQISPAEELHKEFNLCN